MRLPRMLLAFLGLDNKGSAVLVEEQTYGVWHVLRSLDGQFSWTRLEC